MTVIRTGDIAMMQTPGGNATGSVASPGRGATEVLVLRQRQEPGGHNPPHVHDREEVMIQVAGTATVTVNGEVIQLTPGDTLVVPAGATHQVTNTHETPTEWLLVAPAGLRFLNGAGDEVTPAFIV